MNTATSLYKFPLLVLTAGLLALSSPVLAQTVEDQLQAARSALEADRHAVVSEALRLTDAEGAAFWPLYHQYRAAIDKHGDGLARLVLEYAGLYPNVPEARATQMLKELTGLEQKLVSTRASYLKKVAKVLPPTKALRFAQVENRLDLALRLQLAAGVPLVPMEGKLTGEATTAAAALEGVPGGMVVQTYELTATVAAIDPASRKVTLVSPDGIKQTVKAGPEVINFDQIRTGDRLKITATRELVVALAGPGEAADDRGATVVALAPEGAKPGGLAAETVQLTATVTAIDRINRTATLRFDDGTTKTYPVRDDVELGKRQVGERVQFRITEALAISVQKP